jgi:hypothetical protein
MSRERAAGVVRHPGHPDSQGVGSTPADDEYYPHIELVSAPRGR